MSPLEREYIRKQCKHIVEDYNLRSFFSSMGMPTKSAYDLDCIRIAAQWAEVALMGIA